MIETEGTTDWTQTQAFVYCKHTHVHPTQCHTQAPTQSHRHMHSHIQENVVTVWNNVPRFHYPRCLFIAVELRSGPFPVNYDHNCDILLDLPHQTSAAWKGIKYGVKIVERLCFSGCLTTSFITSYHNTIISFLLKMEK